MSEKIRLLPKSNGSRYYQQFETKVAIIADKALHDFYENTAQITAITPSNWRASADMTDVLLITNVEQGLNGEWWGLKDPHSEKRKQLAQIIETYRANDTKIVFYTTEDSGDYKAFLEIAKLCDYVFTASEKRVKGYQMSCKHDRVHVLRSGVNPIRHNPVGFKNCTKIAGAVFSGNWNEQFVKKMANAEMIFDGVIAANNKLSILENYRSLQNANYFFADRHFKYIVDVEKEDLRAVHKLFDWAININSTNYNKTIFADYIYALQASGNIVLSNHNTGINDYFPHVSTIVNKEEVGNIMSALDEEQLYEHQILGIRKVMTHDTNYQRIYEILKLIELDVAAPIKSVVVIIKEDNARIREQFFEQSYPHKKLMLADSLSDDILRDFDFITYFTDEASYGNYYLEDMLNAFKYTDVDFVTKKAYCLNGKLQAGVEHEYVNGYEEKARTVFSTRNYTTLSDLDNKVGIGYAVDHFEFHMGANESLVISDQSYKLSVIIPAFNNGERLHSKAFASLRRSTMFDEMEIIIIDDGSSDKMSLSTIKRLAKSYTNVKTYFYPEGGSGSASRPRNKGVELSTTAYITYLDPDDEMINDGFTTLYNEISSGEYCMVVGDAMMITYSDMKNVDYYQFAIKANDGLDIVNDPQKFLIETNLKPMHLTSLIIKKDLILNNKLTMLEGAFGEDTLFYHELVLNAKRIKLVNAIIFLYYRTIENSATNDVEQVLFEKYLLREQVAQKKYADYGVLEEYLARRYENFFKSWYFPKLSLVSEAQWIPVMIILKKMIDLHPPYYELKDEEMIKFYDLASKEDYNALRAFFANDKPSLSKSKLDKAKMRRQAQAFKERISAKFLSEVEDKLDEMPTSNGSRYYDPLKVRIAIIADAYIYDHCKDSATFIYVTPNNYKDYVGQIDVFLLTNAQSGLAGEWTDLANPKSTNRSVLAEMISDYRGAGAKIVYCATKEHPDSKILIGVAKSCDYIFTTTTEKVATYKSQCNTDQVNVLRWGVNPLIHNPIGCRRFEKFQDVIFSRSCLDAFPRISKQLRKVFDGVAISDYGLTVVKQDFKIMKQQLEMRSTRNYFPQRYWSYILEAVEPEALPRLHKLYDWAININKMGSATVGHGVFELQAMGNLVLANDSVDANVFVVEDVLDVKGVMAKYTDEELYERKMVGVRGVMSRETVYHQLHQMMCTIGIDLELPVRSVAVVVEEDSERVRDMFYLQSYEEKELVFEGDLLDDVVRRYDFIAYFREGVIYGEHYLEDMINAFKYADVDFVTQLAGVEHDYVDRFEDRGRTVFSTCGLRFLSELGDGSLGVGYAVDRFGVR